MTSKKEENKMTIRNQFKEYLENQIHNPMFVSGEEERDIPFTSYSKIEEGSIYLKVDDTHFFTYNCYFQTPEGTCFYEFELA